MMKKQQPTKRALIMSALALLLNISLLIGSTFAWFSDSIVSSSNKIQAGNLDISLDLLEENGSWRSLNKTNEAIFCYDLVEPGFTDIKILRVRNEGTLALKWLAKLVAQEELSILADVVDVYYESDVSEYPTEREALSSWKKIGSISEFLNSVGEVTSGSLEAKEEACFGLAFKMREDADNRYQGLSLGFFDIMILATQYTSESDSFGNDYDSAASYTEQIYFNSISSAFDAISSGTVSENSGCAEKDAVIAVATDKNGYTATLLKSVTANETIKVKSPVTLVLNGNNLIFKKTSVGFMVSLPDETEFSIDGGVSNSTISVSGDSGSTVAEIASGICNITGGTYRSLSDDVGNKNKPNPCIEVLNSATLNLTNAVIVAEDTNKGTPNAVYIGTDGNANIIDSVLIASAPYGLNVNALNCLGEARINNSEMRGYSNYTANAAGTDYASHSRGVYNSGKMVITDSYVIGTHSGIISSGTLLVDGGVYESYGHGGIYFSGSNTTSYVKNATIRWSKMPDGYYDDGVAGTNKAGMYIGGGSTKRNIVVYTDNCVFDAPSQSIVVRGSSGEKDNILYISNSTINTVAKIRVDANNKLSIGSGNNFTKEHTRGKGTVEITDIDYREVIDAAD